MKPNPVALVLPAFMAAVVFLSGIPESDARISCYQCSSHNDTLCPEFMTSDDASVIPYKACDEVYDAAYCVKATGVTGESGAIHCYHCSTATDSNFACSDELFDPEENLSDCSNVFDAQYCIKATGSWGGSLGTRRFCSSKDMGNYCEYIKRVGDPHEYRSCVYTCSGNGCNPANNIKPNLTAMLITAFLTFTTLTLTVSV